MDNIPNLLTGIRLSISENKEVIKIDLLDNTNCEKSEDESVFASFLTPVGSYQTLINALVDMGKDIEIKSGANLGFNTIKGGESNV